MAELQDTEELEAESPGGSGIKKILIIIVATMTLTLGLAFGALYFMGILPVKEAPPVVNEAAPKVKAEMTYVSLDPPFVVNFRGNPEIKLAQISIAVATRKPSSLALLQKHMPVVRNNILLLLGGQDPLVLKTAEGKQALRMKIAEALDHILAEHQHEAPAGQEEGGEEAASEDSHAATANSEDDDEIIPSPIEQILFTAFIMQ